MCNGAEARLKWNSLLRSFVNKIIARNNPYENLTYFVECGWTNVSRADKHNVSNVESGQLHDA